MPGPRRTLAEYVTDRIGQFSDLGGVVNYVRSLDFPDDATIHASVSFGGENEGLLIAYEHLRMDDGRPHRFKYAYRASYGDDFLFRYDRDPNAHPEMPDHKHVAGTERRFESGRVTLHEVAEELWTMVADRQEEERKQSGDGGAVNADA